MGTTATERYEVLRRLDQAGISPDDACQLRRIAMILHRWHELECGDGRGMIERDETTGLPFYHRSNHSYLDPHDPRATYRIPDREAGALKRLKALMYPYRRRFVAYIQGDPRGASLYLVRRKDVPKGVSVDSCYTNGIAIY